MGEFRAKAWLVVACSHVLCKSRCVEVVACAQGSALGIEWRGMRVCVCMAWGGAGMCAWRGSGVHMGLGWGGGCAGHVCIKPAQKGL